MRNEYEPRMSLPPSLYELRGQVAHPLYACYVLSLFDPLGEFVPRLQCPMPGGRTGWRRQYKDGGKAVHRRLFAERQCAGRPIVKQTRGFLARECNCSGVIGSYLCLEACDVERLPGDLMVHPRAGFRKIGEADARFEQRCELARLMTPRRDPDLMQCAPEAVAGMSVVVPDTGGASAGRRANEDEAEVGAKLIGQAMGMAIGHADERNAISDR